MIAPPLALPLARPLALALALLAACAVPVGAQLLVLPPPSALAPELAPKLAQDPRGAPPALFGQELEDPATFGIGRVARDVAKEFPSLDAMAVHLSDRIKDLGYARARPVIARDDGEMIDFLRRGIVDLVSETPLSALHFVHEAHASILLGEERQGHGEYRSVLFVRFESAIGKLEDLRAKRIVLEDTESTTSSLLPLAALKQAGLQVAVLENAQTSPPEQSVGYYFTDSKSAIVAAVLDRSADAGALSDEDWRTLRRKEPGVAANLRLLYESSSIPSGFLLASPTVSANQREKLRAIFLSMETDGPGRAMLDRYNRVNGFRPFNAALQKDIQRLEPTYLLVREEML